MNSDQQSLQGAADSTTAIALANDALARIADGIDSLGRRLVIVEESLAEVKRELHHGAPAKEWYSTSEVAEILDKSDFTVRERWCNQDRIECEKDPDSGKWRIPSAEVHRLRNGGGLRPSGQGDTA